MRRCATFECLRLALFSAIAFTLMKLETSFAQAGMLVYIGVLCLMALKCREHVWWSTFVGTLAAFFVFCLFPHATGTWLPGRPWIELLDPYILFSYSFAIFIGHVVQRAIGNAEKTGELW